MEARWKFPRCWLILVQNMSFHKKSLASKESLAKDVPIAVQPTF